MTILFLLLTGYTVGLFSGIGLIYILRNWADRNENDYPEIVLRKNSLIEDRH